MKTKFNHPKTALSALLLLTTSFAYATPTTTDSFDELWQWLFSQAQQQKAAAVCQSFPSCPEPPPFAPAPAPKEPADKK
jgi:hypothetical protein